ncbi:MAG: tetratricopeptide repeat protein [Promethearchaeota archaeon]
MSNTRPNGIVQVEKLLYEGKFNEALQIVNTVEKDNTLTTDDRLTCQLLKGTLLNKQGKFEEALQIANKVLQESQSLGKALQTIDAVFIMADAYIVLGRFNEALETLLQGEKTLKRVRQKESSKSILRRFFSFRQAEKVDKKKESPEEIGRRKARLLYHKGVIYMRKGDLEQASDYHQEGLALQKEFGDKQDISLSLNNIGIIYWQQGALDKALRYCEESLELFEELGNKQNIARSLNNIGVIYMTKGELDQALENFQKSLTLLLEMGNKHYIAALQGNIGEIYRQQGHLDLALENLSQSLELFEDIGNNLHTSEALFRLIMITIDKPSPELAQQYLERLQKINEQEKNKIISQRYRVSNALILKSSQRARKRVKAEELLEQVAGEEIVDHEVTVVALLGLCDLLLSELLSSGNQEILDDVKPLVNRLLEIAKAQHSHSLLVESYMLNANLALVDLNLNEARRLLTQAQFIAEERDLKRLAMKISNEHDILLEQLSKWEELIERNASLTERAEFAHLEDVMRRMLQKRAVDIPEVTEEKPILFLILSGSGLCRFSKTFLPEGEVNDQLIGGFLTAIQGFSTEIFAQSIDRVKMEKYTLLMKSEEPFLMCYVFQGQSYTAQQKLSQFTNNIHNALSMWQALKEIEEKGSPLTDEIKDYLDTTLTNTFSV